MLDCIILGSMDIGQEVAKQCFPLDVLDHLMVGEVNEPGVVVWALENILLFFLKVTSVLTLSTKGITYLFRHMCCQSHHVAW